MNMKIFLIEKLVSIWRKREEIIYIDESSFNNRITSFKKWVRNEENDILHLPVHGNVLSPLTAHTTTGFKHWKICNYSVDSSTFFGFLKEVTNNIKSDSLKRQVLEKGLINLYLDNSTVHLSAEIIDYLKKENIRRIKAVPNDCLYNASEYVYC